MTEDQNDQTTDEPASERTRRPRDRRRPRCPRPRGQAAIALPARPPRPGGAHPAAPAARHAPARHPPAGCDPARGHDPAPGHLRHGRPGRQPHARASRRRRPLGGPPPTDPGAPMWPAPPAPGAALRAATNHRVRNGLLAGAAALAVLARRRRHRPRRHWDNGRNTQAFAPTSGGTHLPSGPLGRLERPSADSGSSNSPFGQRLDPSAARATRATRATTGQRQLGLVQLLGPERRERHRVEGRPRASSTSTRRSATSRSRPPARASCSRPTA